MADLNKQSLEMWNAMKPMVDREIDQQTKGAVQRRKAKVTTAPSLVTKKIGVTEPFGDQYFIPYDAKVAGAKVGDVVWVEYMYGASNAFASMFAKAVEDPKSCSATLSSAGWYRAIKIPSAYGSVRIRIQREWGGTAPEVHNIELLICYKNGSYSATWCNEESSSYDSSSVVIDKIRCTRSTLFNGFYVDIHYSTTASNVPVITFDASTTQAYGNNVTAESLQSVADAPSGETVLTTYQLSANGVSSVAVTSTHSSVTVNSSSCVRSGKNVSLWVDFTVSSAISGYGVLLSCPTFASNVIAVLYDSGYTMQTNMLLYADAGNTGLRCYDHIAAGRYKAYVSYITSD